MIRTNPRITIGWSRNTKPDAFWFGEDCPVHYGPDESVPLYGHVINDITDEDEVIGDVMSVAEWLELVECEAVIDYDGFGDQVIFNSDSRLYFMLERKGSIFGGIYPSEYKELNRHTTHIIWYNR